ncbi:RNA-binding protein 34 [Porphyridium purpureum]|uniref:RNA-binding protein 34 n=1 Tax=Porphyridium purpureum TaxID=35688 RepID=A0A5J4YT46_PORPP|nr:RNA-binding protein 34 [Porphyridium purpureum]|eukprot:POR2162..scf229_5
MTTTQVPLPAQEHRSKSKNTSKTQSKSKVKLESEPKSKSESESQAESKTKLKETQVAPRAGDVDQIDFLPAVGTRRADRKEKRKRTGSDGNKGNSLPLATGDAEQRDVSTKKLKKPDRKRKDAKDGAAIEAKAGSDVDNFHDKTEDTPEENSAAVNNVTEEEAKALAEKELIEARRASVLLRKVPPGTKKKDLRTVLTEFGTIVSVKLLPDECSATVRFESRESAAELLRHGSEGRDLLVGDTKLQVKRLQDELRKSQTVFVGNVPAAATRKQLTRLFSQFGKIESVRLRSIAPPKLGMPKRVAAMTRQVHEQRDNYNAYIVFTDEASAKTACSLNGSEFLGKCIRVDLESSKTAQISEADTRRSVFIGNLAWNASEDDLRACFTPVGSPVVNVRIIRDERTGMGKGFGYVAFEDEFAVSEALLLNNTAKCGGRRLRISRCTASGKSEPAGRVRPRGMGGPGAGRPGARAVEGAKLRPYEGVRATRDGGVSRASPMLNIRERRRLKEKKGLKGVSKPAPRHAKRNAAKGKRMKGKSAV